MRLENLKEEILMFKSKRKKLSLGLLSALLLLALSTSALGYRLDWRKG